VPPPLIMTEHETERQRPDSLNPMVRFLLVSVVAGLLAVFWLARWKLNPYDAEGVPNRLETHTQLGLPPCTFKVLVHKPCPSCGMTTAFSLLAHGDLANSLAANWVGTLLALFCLVLLPWAVASLVRRRTLWIRSLERGLSCVVFVFLALMLIRWAIVLGHGT